MFQHKIIKNCFVICLMALASSPMLFPFYLFAKKQFVRFEMRAKLEQQAIVPVRVHQDSVHWVEAGKEIRIDNRLFDIKNADQDGEYLIFFGLFDQEEREI